MQAEMQHRRAVVQRHVASGVEAFQVNLRPKPGGRPLPPDVQAKMEAALGGDFSGVRVHVGHGAPRIGAIAFTWGSDIHFAPGLYQPNTHDGQKLLAHELTHVLQQRAGRVRNPFGGGVAVVQDRALEAEADMAASRLITLPRRARVHSSPTSVIHGTTEVSLQRMTSRTLSLKRIGLTTKTAAMHPEVLSARLRTAIGVPQRSVRGIQNLITRKPSRAVTQRKSSSNTVQMDRTLSNGTTVLRIQKKCYEKHIGQPSQYLDSAVVAFRGSNTYFPLLWGEDDIQDAVAIAYERVANWTPTPSDPANKEDGVASAQITKGHTTLDVQINIRRLTGQDHVISAWPTKLQPHIVVADLDAHDQYLQQQYYAQQQFYAQQQYYGQQYYGQYPPPGGQ